jgi:hypothetical protein
MRLSLRRHVTEGVHLRGGTVEHSGLGCSAPVGSLDALELGLVSQRAALALGERRLDLPPWFTSAAIPLPHGIGAATLATLRHQASGMAPLLLAAVATLLAGLASASSGLTALGALALLVLVSVLVHELGHVVVYRALFGRAAPALVVVRGASCHVVRRADGSRADGAVVVAGGAAPALVALASLPLVGVAPYPVLLGALIALGHLVALALPFGDGASLRSISAARRRRVTGARG